MVKRTLISKVLTGAFVGMIMFVSASGVRAYANNNSDTWYDFGFDNGGTQETERRSKEDTSASWMSCRDCDGEDVGYRAYVYGYSSYSSNDGQSYSSGYTFYDGDTKYMRNWVKENDRDYASIKADLMSGICVGYSGWWSPDNGSGY